MKHYSSITLIPMWTQLVKQTRSLGQLSLAAVLLMATPAAGLAQSSSVTPSPADALVAQAVLTDVEEYLLGPGDRVRIDFFNVPELSGEFQVLPNGTINVPQIGSVSVRGRTLGEAQTQIGNRAAAILRYPLVTVSLLSARPIKIAVAGEVNQPGSYSLSTENTAQATAAPSLTNVLRLAQGVTQAADIGQVRITRPDPMGQKGDIVFTANLWELLDNADLRADVRLRDGDSVFVPTAQSIDKASVRKLAAADFATSPSRPLKIVVLGEVNRPGPYTITGNAARDNNRNVLNFQAPTVTQAIQSAGGITQSADIRDITVSRVTRDGSPQVAKVNFGQLLTAGPDGEGFLEDLPLQDGDTIVIGRAEITSEADLTALGGLSVSPSEIQVNVAGEVVRPGTVTLKPNTPLNQALLAAGGYNERARQGRVTLIRLNPNGSVMKEDIDIDLAAGVSSETNPALRNGDTLVIARSTADTVIRGIGTVLNPFSGLFNLFRAFFN